MDKVHVIRHKVLVEGQSIRSVARQLGVSRNTVDKYIKVSEPIRMAGQPKPRPEVTLGKGVSNQVSAANGEFLIFRGLAEGAVLTGLVGIWLIEQTSQI